MVEDMLCTGPVHALPELVSQCDFSAEAFLLLERLPQRVVLDEERQNLLSFARLRDIEPEDFADYTASTSGRIFDQDSELRWEHDIASGTTSVVYLGKARTFTDLKQDEEELARLKPADNNPRHYYLFGKSLAERDLEQMGIAAVPETAYYAEVRIPRLLPYPKVNARPPQRLKLAVYEYVDQETGLVKLFRFQGLQPAE